MDQINVERTCVILNQILEYELAGVVRYTHYGLMIVGPYRQPIIDFMNGQASESLLHAQQAGEIITGLGGHPSQRIASIEETNNHDVKPILQESLEHEMNALNLYRSLLKEVSKFYNNSSKPKEKRIPSLTHHSFIYTTLYRLLVNPYILKNMQEI